jgi:hypothetical protein
VSAQEQRLWSFVEIEELLGSMVGFSRRRAGSGLPEAKRQTADVQRPDG